MLYSLRLRVCSPCPVSECNNDLESVRKSTYSEATSNVWPFGSEIKLPGPPYSTASIAEPSAYSFINVACGSSMCESVRSFLDVSSWSLVTVGIVVRRVRILLVRSDNMDELEYVQCTILIMLLL